MTRDDLLHCLTALDFVSLDLALYLDTHPDDCEALDKYNETVCKAAEIRSKYEKTYGPLYSYRSPSTCPWQWYEDPWPWQYCFNFSTTKEGCC